MPDSDQDDSQKTEDPTQKRLQDAQDKGQVPKSREVTSFAMLLVFAVTLIWMTPGIMRETTRRLQGFVGSANELNVDGYSVILLMSDLIGDIAILMATPIAIIILMIFLSSIIQHPLIFSTQSMQPKLERISPLAGLKRMFSMRSLMEFVKGVLKITLVGIVAWIAIYPELNAIENLPALNIMAMLLFLSKIIGKVMIGVLILMGLIGVVDFIYQRFEHTKSLRMSLQDIKDEYKQTEGNPEVKAKLREIRNKRAQERMMSNVPKADVIVTNPTHYSIALQYEETKTTAPVVVAKGQDFIALKIREIANENNIPIVENPPLARALFASVEIDEEIPFEHYQAVAEVIRYVYKLKGKL